MTDEMEAWITRVLEVFPPREVINPIDEDLDSLSREERRERLNALSEREHQWHRAEVTDKITPAEALDYYMLTYGGFTANEWARLRDRGSESVRKNKRQAEQKLQELRTVENIDLRYDGD